MTRTYLTDEIPTGLCPVCGELNVLPIVYYGGVQRIAVCGIACWRTTFAAIFGDPSVIGEPGDRVSFEGDIHAGELAAVGDRRTVIDDIATPDPASFAGEPDHFERLPPIDLRDIQNQYSFRPISIEKGGRVKFGPDYRKQTFDAFQAGEFRPIDVPKTGVATCPNCDWTSAVAFGDPINHDCPGPQPPRSYPIPAGFAMIVDEAEHLKRDDMVWFVPRNAFRRLQFDEVGKLAGDFVCPIRPLSGPAIEAGEFSQDQARAVARRINDATDAELDEMPRRDFAQLNEVTGEANRLFAAAVDVADAWNDPGRAPHVHEAAKHVLRSNWRTLAKAVQRLAEILK